MKLPGQTDEVIDDLKEELDAQFNHYGYVYHPLPLWVTIITEEVGEVAREILNFKSSEEGRYSLYGEAIQVAAIALAEQVRRM